jgi:hypothetical protein
MGSELERTPANGFPVSTSDSSCRHHDLIVQNITIVCTYDGDTYIDRFQNTKPIVDNSNKKEMA